MPAAVELLDIHKSFGGVNALRGVSFRAEAGEVAALVGENGAGKSTLLKILSGALIPDRGEIRLNGTRVDLHTPALAQRAGIAIIYQELSVLSDLSIAENIYLNRLPMRGLLVDWSRLRAECRALLAQLQLRLEPSTRLGALSLARQQMVEIARAVSQDGRIIAMDEPTASLTDEEVQSLYQLIQRLQRQGVTVIYVSHRLEEVFTLADRITVLRDGQAVGTLARQEARPERVVEMMVGRGIDQQFPKVAATPGQTVLEVRDLWTRELLRGVSLSVRRGEVVALAGLVGAGRTELARAIFGADPIERGSILLEGKPVRIRHPGDAVRLGIGYVPEDRKRSGLLLNFRLFQNHSLPSLKKFVRAGRLNPRLEVKGFSRWMRDLRIRASSAYQVAANLSGGNQQKVVLAKWLELAPRLLILDEPTRGVDVGAKVELYEIINRLASQGTAVLMISSDLPEVLGMNDRVVVMHDGRVTGDFNRAEATKERVMAAAIA